MPALLESGAPPETCSASVFTYPRSGTIKRTSIQNLSLQLRANLRQIALLLLLTAAAIFVHGYHPYVEDAEIYVPGVKKALNPALYPANTAFFLSHAKMTIFPHLIAGSVRVTHIRLSVALLLWQFAAIFFLLWACWRIGQLAFRDSLAAWGGADREVQWARSSWSTSRALSPAPGIPFT